MIVAVAVVGLAAFAWMAADLLFLVFGGILLAVFLRAVCVPIAQRTPLSENAVLTFLLVAVVLAVAAAIWLFGPQMVAQFEGMGEEVTEVVSEVREMLEEQPWGRQLITAFEGEDGAALEWAGGFFFGAVEGFIYFLTFLLVGLFIAYRPGMYTEGVIRLFPMQHRPHVEELIDELGYILRWWLIGRALAMLMIGVSTTILLTVLDIPLALLLGVIAGLLTFVPYLGPLAAAVPIALVSMLEGPVDMLWAVGLYAILEHIEGYVLDPIIQRMVVYLPPALTVALQVFMGLIFGALGIALATPLAAVGMVIIQRSYIERKLGDYNSEEEANVESDADRKPKQIPEEKQT